MKAGRHSSAIVGGCVAMAALGASRSALAQSNYRSGPLGGRSVLMGGTGVALATDGSGPFTNPATITRVVDSGVAFSVNLYSLSIHSLGSWMTPGAIDRARYGDVTASGASTTDVEFRPIPSTLCLFVFSPTGAPKTDTGNEPKPEPTTSLPARSPVPHQLALCFGAVQRADLGLTDSIASTSASGRTTRVSQAISQSWVRYALGPTYARKLSEAWSVGVSVHARVSLFHAKWTASSLLYDADGGNVASSDFRDEARAVSLDFAALLGATYRSGDLTIGVGVDLPSAHLYGKDHAYRFTAAPGAATSSTIADGSFDARAPLKVGIGVANEWDALTGEADVSIAFPLSRAFDATLDGSRADVTAGSPAGVSALHVTESDPARLVVNGAIGGEMPVASTLSVLAGLSTDLSSAPASAMNDARVFHYFVENRQRVGGSVGMGSYGSGGELLFGFDASYGFGDRLAVDAFESPPGLVPTPHHDVTITFVVAGATSIRTLRRAVRDVKTLVKPEGSE